MTSGMTHEGKVLTENFSQFLLSALRLMGTGAPGRLPTLPSGHLTRNLTHPAPRRIPSFPPTL